MSISRTPGFGSALLLGLLLVSVRDGATQTALPSGPANAMATCAQAYAARQYALAATCYKSVAAQAKDLAVATAAQVDYANALLKLQDLVGAESALRSALTKDSQSARALYLLGYVLQRRNQPQASLQSYTAAAAIQRPSAEILRQVALDYVLLQDYVDAEHWLSRAVAENPQDAEAWYDLGRVHMHGGRFVEAQAELQHSLTLRPSSAKAEENLGICLEAQNQIDAALSAYRRAVQIADTEAHPSELPFIDYGKLLIERNAGEAALPLLKRATAINPRSSEAFAQLSRAASATGDQASALVAMQHAVDLDATNPRLHFQLARLYKSAGEAAEAEKEFKLSSELYGQSSHE